MLDDSDDLAILEGILGLASAFQRTVIAVTDHPNGATHVRPNGATLGCHIPPQTGCIFSLF
jgi:hypothetical protein